MAKKWIQGAIQRPGALTQRAKNAGVSLAKFETEKHKSPVINKEIALAKTLSRFHKKA